MEVYIDNVKRIAQVIDNLRVVFSRADLGAVAERLKPTDQGIAVIVSAGSLSAHIIDHEGKDPCEIAGLEVLSWLC